MGDPRANDVTDAPNLSERRRRPRIIVAWGTSAIARDLPQAGTCLLGRGDEADIRISHGSVSRLHARLSWDDSGVCIEDLGSSNGTLVEGRRLSKGVRTPVRAGTLVEIGSALLGFHESGVSGPSEPSNRPAPLPGLFVDEAMIQLREVLQLAASSKLSVILLGETGVGKEVLASELHARSARAAGPFIKVNCAALVESLLEAELFGYERGAFTGATQRKLGLIDAANGGTLFLDELGEMPLSTQSKLLRVLEHGEVMRVGSLKPTPVDVRFVAATNRDLAADIAAGRFRSDLYFRLEGISIRIPPLRERPQDILHLARVFATDAARDAGRPVPQWSDAALAALVQHTWPGNVRELKNLVSRAVLFCRSGTLERSDLSFAPATTSQTEARVYPIPAAESGVTPTQRPPSITKSEAADDEARILEALRACAGNQTRAAKLLGISRAKLIARLNILGIPRPRR